MNPLSTFTFKDQAIRVIDREGSPWFVAAAGYLFKDGRLDKRKGF